MQRAPLLAPQPRDNSTAHCTLPGTALQCTAMILEPLEVAHQQLDVVYNRVTLSNYTLGGLV
jgi:hypothetical protein